MKESSIPEKTNVSSEVIKPISIKMNQNNLETYNHFFPEELIIPEDLSDKEIELLKEKNKWFFFKYSKLAETNNLLKFKL